MATQQQKQDRAATATIPAGAAPAAPLPTAVNFAVGMASGVSGWLFVHPADVVKVSCLPTCHLIEMTVNKLIGRMSCWRIELKRSYAHHPCAGPHAAVRRGQGGGRRDGDDGAGHSEAGGVYRCVGVDLWWVCGGASGSFPVTTISQSVLRHVYTGLYSGLSAAIARQMSYTTLRLGFFDEIKGQLAQRKIEETAFTRCVSFGLGWNVYGSPCGSTDRELTADQPTNPTGR